MNNLLNESSSNLPLEKIDIFCLRILANKIINNTPLLFNISGDREIPIDICLKPCPCPEDIEKKAAETLVAESKKLKELIESNASTDVLLKANEDLVRLVCSLKPREECFDKEIKCIDNIKFICVETREDFICNHKVRLKIKFKVLLIVKFMDCCLGLILLPDDSGTKFCFNNISFPVIHNSDGIKKTLDLDNINKVFVLTIEIPLKQFKGNLPYSILDDPALQSKITIKCLQHKYDIFEGECTCNREAKTHISLISTADIIDRIGIGQDVWIKGNPDEC